MGVDAVAVVWIIKMLKSTSFFFFFVLGPVLLLLRFLFAF